MQKRFGHWKSGNLCLFGIWILVFGFFSGCSDNTLYKDNRIMMGTFVEVISPDKNASGIVFEEISRIEGLLSKYKPDSQVSRLNKTGKVNAGPELFYCVSKAREYWKNSNGAFDITVAPLMDIWGFTDRNFTVPDKGSIKKTLKLIGSDKIIMDKRDNAIKLKVRGMKIDLGAIAKGYAVDCAVKKLKAAGINSCLINAGGQIHCMGSRFGKPWKIAVEAPSGRGFVDYLLLKDNAVATSGNYQQFFVKDGKSYAHIFDPRTGYPSRPGFSSVTVIAQDGLTADAIATAVFVLGIDGSRDMITKFPEVSVRFTP